MTRGADFHVWFLDTVHPVLQARLEAAGMTCHDATTLTREDLLAAAQTTPVHALVLRSRIRLTADLLRALPDLHWIARSGSGLENIDLKVAAELGVAVHSSPEGNRDAVAEHATGLLLNLLNHIQSGDATIRERQWLREAHRGRELKTMTVGIVGYGHMGHAFAQRLGGFGCRVLAYDKHKEGWGDSPTVDRPLPHVTPAPLEQLHAEADVVSLHLPWTEETKGLVNATWLGKWAKPIVLLNTARGPIVRTIDLLDALDAGKVWRAGLDVLEFEGRSLESLSEMADPEAREAFERLLADRRVLLTPHVAGWTEESLVKLSSVLADKILGHEKAPADGQGFSQ